jgi:hypothetical protein
VARSCEHGDEPSSSITMELDYTILVVVSYPRGFLEITFSRQF